MHDTVSVAVVGVVGGLSAVVAGGAVVVGRSVVVGATVVADGRVVTGALVATGALVVTGALAVVDATSVVLVTDGVFTVLAVLLHDAVSMMTNTMRSAAIAYARFLEPSTPVIVPSPLAE